MALPLLVMGCSRPLSENEAEFAAALFGPTLAVDEVRVAQGFGLAPIPAPRPFRFREGRIRDGACERAGPKARSEPPQAFAFRNRLYFASRSYTSDAVAGWPDRIRVNFALLFAHELVHVWQWQNRHATGYTPWKAVREGLTELDPYFYRTGTGRRFEEFGYEQQASLLEDYLCFRFLNPTSPRRAELYRILAPIFPLDVFENRLHGGGP